MKVKIYSASEIKKGGNLAPQPAFYVEAREFNILLDKYKRAYFLLEQTKHKSQFNRLMIEDFLKE